MKKINKLLIITSAFLLAPVTLTSCSLFNKNSADSSGQNNKPSEPEVEKFDLSFLLDDSYQIVNATGFTLDENGYASVEKGTQISFEIEVNQGVELDEEGLIVKVNNNEIGEIDGIYKFTITKDIFVTVEGFAEEHAMHRIGVNAPYGVTLIADEEANPDGSYFVNSGEFSFRLELLPGFSASSLEVKANGETLTDIDGLYKINVNSNVNIEISGVSYNQLQVTMQEDELFSFTNVKGATIKNGIAYVNETEVSFKIIPSILADKDLSVVVVKHNNEILEDQNGVYSFVPHEESQITVSGLVKYSETSQKTGNTCYKNILADVAATTIITTNGAVVSGSVDDMADIQNGYKKATYFAGEYGANQLSLNSNEPFEKFKYLEFEINPITNDYIEFFSPLSSNPLFYIRDKGWTKIKIQKTDDGDSYHYYVDGKDKGEAAQKDMLISSLQFKLQGSYLFSELICLKDPDYIDPHYYSDIKALSSAVYVPGKDEETEYGVKKWYQITDSSYNVAHNFSSLNPEKYVEMAFEIMPIGEYTGGPWFGLNAAGSTGGFTKDVPSLAIFSKNDTGKWTLTLKGKSTAEFPGLDLGTDLNTTKMYLHPNSGKVSFLVSNFRFIDDPEYDEFGQKSVTIVEHDLGQNLTYSVQGQSGSSFKVDMNSDVVITLNPASGYDGVIKVNGDVVKGNNNVYTISITRTTIIDIYVKVHHDIIKLMDLICDGESATGISDNCFVNLDPEVTTVYKNAKSSGTLYPTKSYDLTNLNYLYFYCWNKENTQLQLYPGSNETNCTTVAKKGDKFMIEIKRENGKWNFYLDNTLLEKLCGKETNNLEGLFYLQFWGTNYLSPLFGY